MGGCGKQLFWTCSLARNQRDTLSFLRPKGTTLLEIYKFICDCVFDKLGKFLFTSSIPFESQDLTKRSLPARKISIFYRINLQIRCTRRSIGADNRAKEAFHSLGVARWLPKESQTPTQSRLNRPRRPPRCPSSSPAVSIS